MGVQIHCLDSFWLDLLYYGSSFHRIKNNKLFRSYECDSFLNAIEFINKIAQIAEKEDHHPNITNVYNKVEIILL